MCFKVKRDISISKRLKKTNKSISKVFINVFPDNLELLLKNLIH